MHAQVGQHHVLDPQAGEADCAALQKWRCGRVIPKAGGLDRFPSGLFHPGECYRHVPDP